VKRSPLVFAGTLLGLAGVLSFHTAPANISLSKLSTAGTTTSGTSSTPSTTTPTPTTSAATTTVAPSRRERRSHRTAPATSTPATTTPTTTTKAPTPTTTSGTRSATGPLVNYNFGVLSVTVTASGSKITAVTIGSLNDGGNYRSQSIDGMAIPILEQEVMAAQNGTIQSVSGASWTSAGFSQSLQAALSKLGI
jgi:uncharacterized protein with FMN-binding domain